MKHIFIVSLALLSVFKMANAQYSQGIAQWFDAVKEGRSLPVPGFVEDNPLSHQEALSTTFKYYTDTFANVRSQAYRLTALIAGISNDEAIIDAALNNLVVYGLADQNTGLIYQAANRLGEIPAKKYGAHHRKSIYQYLNNPANPYRDILARLSGRFHEEAAVDALYPLANDPSGPSNLRWAAMIALARLGEENMIDKTVSIFNGNPTNDALIYNLVPDMVYIRQPKAMKAVTDLLYEDGEHCLSPNPYSNRQIHCGYRILEYLAPAIKDFPLKLDETGELETKNYEKALKEAREWFKENPAYELIENE